MTTPLEVAFIHETLLGPDIFPYQIRSTRGVGLAERIAYKPVNQGDPGSNPTRGTWLKSDP